MALISKELQKRGSYSALLLTLGAFLLNGEIVFNDHLIALSTLGTLPLIVAHATLHIFGQFIPKLKEMHESGEVGKMALERMKTQLALLIVAAESLLVRFDMLNTSLQLSTTYALCEINKQLDRHGLGSGITQLFLVQLIKEIATESHVLLHAFTGEKLIEMSLLIAPIVAATSLYHRTQYTVPIVTRNTSNRTTHHLTSKISVTLTRKPCHINTLPIRVAAAGTMPLMHAFSLFTLIGLDTSWLIVFGAMLIFIYVLETTQAINTHHIAKKLKQLNHYIASIRPGKDTRDYLNKVLMQIIAIGVPIILVMGIFPFLFFDAQLAHVAISIPFLVCEAQNMIRQAKAYNIHYSEGVILCNKKPIMI